MMEAMKRVAPGEAHGVLQPLVGTWTCTVKGWMTPGDKPLDSKGTAESRWVFGGRFVQQDFEGDWAGQSFEGVGYTGYDNLRQEYVSVWMDNMSTGMMQVTGSFDSKSRVLQSKGHFSCPITGEKNRWVRSEAKIIDNDHNTYTSTFLNSDGKEFKSMEITYTRKK